MKVPAYKVLLVGEPNVGKSSLIRRVLLGEFDPEYTATIGVDLSAVALNVDEFTPVLLTIIDLGGQTDFTALRTQYYRGAHAACLVYDITSRDTFDCLDIWYEGIQANIESMNGRSLYGLVLGNKSDAADEREVPVVDGRLFADRVGWPFYETSAKNGQNVEEVFDRVAKHLYTCYPPAHQLKSTESQR